MLNLNASIYLESFYHLKISGPMSKLNKTVMAEHSY